MKAAVLYGKEDVRIEDVPMRPLGEGEVRVQIEAALTCGTDLKVFKRGYHARMLVPPAVFGHELAGTISEVAPGVPVWRVGDRVVAANSAPCGECFYCANDQENLCDHLDFLNGAYAESIVIPKRIVRKNLLRLAPATAFADAALVEPLACVAQGVKDAGLRKGQRLLVIGAGPIGLMFAALGRQAGCEVTVAGRGEKRLAAARELGAKEVLEVRDPNDTLAAFPPGAAYDVVIEAVGRPQTWEAATRLVRKGGTINFFGGCPSGTTVSLDTGLIHYSNLKLLASFHHTPATVREALGWIEKGVVTAKRFVDGASPLSELPALFRSMASGNHAVKTLIAVRE